MRQEQMQKWAWLVLAYVSVAAAFLLGVQFFRYSLVPSSAGMPLLWDRWRQCLVLSTDPTRCVSQAGHTVTANALLIGAAVFLALVWAVLRLQRKGS